MNALTHLANKIDTGCMIVAADNDTNAGAPNSSLPTDLTSGHLVDLNDDPIVLGLKRLYDSVLEEDVPADFLDLLGQIDASIADQAGETKAPNEADAPSTHTGGLS
jgi:hypothetical protein